MDFESNWTNIKASPRDRKRLRPYSVAAWALWAAFILVWLAALVPFYARGLHLISITEVNRPGGGPYIPLRSVYGTSALGGLAQVVVFLGPCLFALAAVCVLARLLASWHTYSTPGFLLRVAALLLTAILWSQSMYMALTFITWGAE